MLLLRRAALILASALMFSAPAHAQKTSPAITIADLKSRLYRIADDSMQGRETGSKGDFLTAAYVANEFARLGLKPAGEDGWFQKVPFYVLGSALPSITVDGAAPLMQGRDFIAAPIATTNTLDGARAVYGGVVADSTTWIDAATARDRIVILAGDPTSLGVQLRNGLNAGFRARRFASARAVAIVQLDRIPHGIAVDIGRSRVTRDSSRTTRALALVISEHAATTLLGNATRTTGMLGAAVHGGGMQVVPTEYPARNVIGILEGSDPRLRAEYVSLTAHNDHVGVCQSAVDHDSLWAHNRVIRTLGADTPDRDPNPDEARKITQLRDSLRRLRPTRADSICNGADDDGSGTVALLELAESFASMAPAARPHRSLLFVSHVGEERGLVGSAWYTDHATVPVDSIIAEIDEDMVGRGSVTDNPKGGPGYLEVVGARRLSNEFGDLLEAANAAQPKPFVFNYEFDAPGHPLQYYCRADHYSYARYGIPSVAFSRGEHLDYHQVTDEAQYIDYDDMLRVVNMVHDAALRVANADHAPRLNQPKGDPHARCVQ